MMTTRDMAKKAIRDQISLAALHRFQINGFDKTTVEEIALDVGMSVRTFFRYFRTKEEVLLAPSVTFSATFLEKFSCNISVRDLWGALEEALVQTAQACEKLGDGKQSRELQALVSRTPALLARQLAIGENLQLEATELAMSRCVEAKRLSWGMTNAIIRSAFACQRAVQCRLDGDIQSEEAIEQLRGLMMGLRPVALN